jgi:hypothetical protein
MTGRAEPNFEIDAVRDASRAPTACWLALAAGLLPSIAHADIDAGRMIADAVLPYFVATVCFEIALIAIAVRARGRFAGGALLVAGAAQGTVAGLFGPFHDNVIDSFVVIFATLGLVGAAAAARGLWLLVRPRGRENA